MLRPRGDRTSDADVTCYSFRLAPHRFAAFRDTIADAPVFAPRNLDGMALFGCAPKRPLDYLGSAGLLWAINGGRLVELHRNWAVIDVPLHRSQRIFNRRNVDAAKITLPWARQPAALARQGPRKAGGPPTP